MKTFTIPVDIYSIKVEFWYGSQEDAKNELENSNFPIKSDFNAEGNTLFEEGFDIIVWIKENYDPYSFIPTLSHEMNHATFFILKDVGVDYDEDTHNEAFTYLQDYLVEQALRKLKYFDGKKRNRKK